MSKSRKAVRQLHLHGKHGFATRALQELHLGNHVTNPDKTVTFWGYNMPLRAEALIEALLGWITRQFRTLATRAASITTSSVTRNLATLPFTSIDLLSRAMRNLDASDLRDYVNNIQTFVRWVYTTVVTAEGTVRSKLASQRAAIMAELSQWGDLTHSSYAPILSRIIRTTRTAVGKVLGAIIAIAEQSTSQLILGIAEVADRLNGADFEGTPRSPAGLVRLDAKLNTLGPGFAQPNRNERTHTGPLKMGDSFLGRLNRRLLRIHLYRIQSNVKLEQLNLTEAARTRIKVQTSRAIVRKWRSLLQNILRVPESLVVVPAVVAGVFQDAAQYFGGLFGIDTESLTSYTIVRVFTGVYQAMGYLLDKITSVAVTASNVILNAMSNGYVLTGLSARLVSHITTNVDGNNRAFENFLAGAGYHVKRPLQTVPKLHAYGARWTHVQNKRQQTTQNIAIIPALLRRMRQIAAAYPDMPQSKHVKIHVKDVEDELRRSDKMLATTLALRMPRGGVYPVDLEMHNAFVSRVLSDKSATETNGVRDIRFERPRETLRAITATVLAADARERRVLVELLESMEDWGRAARDELDRESQRIRESAGLPPRDTALADAAGDVEALLGFAKRDLSDTLTVELATDQAAMRLRANGDNATGLSARNAQTLNKAYFLALGFIGLTAVVGISSWWEVFTLENLSAVAQSVGNYARIAYASTKELFEEYTASPGFTTGLAPGVSAESYAASLSNGAFQAARDIERSIVGPERGSASEYIRRKYVTLALQEAGVLDASVDPQQVRGEDILQIRDVGNAYATAVASTGNDREAYIQVGSNILDRINTVERVLLQASEKEGSLLGRFFQSGEIQLDFLRNYGLTGTFSGPALFDQQGIAQDVVTRNRMRPIPILAPIPSYSAPDGITAVPAIAPPNAYPIIPTAQSVNTTEGPDEIQARIGAAPLGLSTPPVSAIPEIPFVNTTWAFYTSTGALVTLGLFAAAGIWAGWSWKSRKPDPTDSRQAYYRFVEVPPRSWIGKLKAALVGMFFTARWLAIYVNVVALVRFAAGESGALSPVETWLVAISSLALGAAVWYQPDAITLSHILARGKQK